MIFRRLILGLQRMSSSVLAPSLLHQPTGVASGPVFRTIMTGRFSGLHILSNSLKVSESCGCRPPTHGSLLSPSTAMWSQPVRTRVQYSRTRGKPRSVIAVTKRFFRLHNGQWIRTIAGRNKRKWAKTAGRKNRAQEHLMCNRTQCRLLDRMVGPYFKYPRYYPNDPYAPYHKWENLPHFRVLRDKPRFLP